MFADRLGGVVVERSPSREVSSIPGQIIQKTLNMLVIAAHFASGLRG